MPYPLPNRAWEGLGIDIFTCKWFSYVVLFDAYSNWLELLQIKNKSIELVINQINPVFARFGPPDVVVSDNVPFNSHKIVFLQRNGTLTLFLEALIFPNLTDEKAVAISKVM